MNCILTHILVRLLSVELKRSILVQFYSVVSRLPRRSWTCRRCFTLRTWRTAMRRRAPKSSRSSPTSLSSTTSSRTRTTQGIVESVHFCLCCTSYTWVTKFIICIVNCIRIAIILKASPSSNKCVSQ